MKTTISILLVLSLASCSKPVEVESKETRYNVDSLILANQHMTDTLMIVQVEAAENVKSVIEKIVYENKVLKEKTKVVERVVVRDTVWIKESEQKNFWGKTKTQKEVTHASDSTESVTEEIY
jgi:hypothetical protein